MKHFLSIITLAAAMMTLSPILPAARQKKQAEAPKPEIVSQWNGCKVGFLGDSIIDEGQLKSNNTFPHILADLMGIEPHVYGISGHEVINIIPQATRMEEELGQDVDAIIIFIGTNDYNHAVPLGQWYEEKSEKVKVSGPMDVIRRHRTPVMTDDTFCGRINKTMAWLKHHYPTKQIILMTPIHRALFHASDRNHQPEETYTNAIGLYIDDYVEVLKQASNVWAVPVIDLNALCGLYPLEPEHGVYFRNSDTDRLHPNTMGHTRMARTIAYQLTTLPAKFE